MNNIVGVTLTEDGTVVVASKGGNVTALRADSSSFSSSSSGANFGMGTLTPVSYLPLSHFVASPSPIHISNSIAVHKQGIYIVTQEEVARIDIDPPTARLDFRWSRRYGREGLPWYTSRLGPGSGSTPSLTTCRGRDMVVLTDGELEMNLIYLDAETGEEVARSPVDFGEGVDAARLTSEQSVAVRGCQAFVVNNYVGTEGLDEDTHCTDAPVPALREGLADFCNLIQPTFIRKVCPAVFGCMGYGAAMYSLEEGKLARVWARDDVSCGTSIPLISDPTDGSPSTTYCVGMPRNETRWTLLAFDTDTGADQFQFPFYPEGKDRVANFFANPYYAGVEAVSPHMLAIGSIGGLNYITPVHASLLHAPSSFAPSSSITSASSSTSSGSAVALAVVGLGVMMALVVRGSRRWRGQGREQEKEEEDVAGYVPL